MRFCACTDDEGMMHDANVMNRGHEMVLEKYG
jgi:hypothetical protein